VVKLVGGRLIGSLLIMLFLHVLILDGVVPTKTISLPGRENNTVVLSFDVCGHGASANAIEHFDLTAVITSLPSTFLFIKRFPPIPDEAVASAETGEPERPPKA